MSGGTAAGVLPPSMALSITNRNVVRHAFGVTLALAAAAIVDWPVAFLCPVLVNLLLSTRRPITLREGFRFVVLITVIMGCAAFFSVIAGSHPSVFLTLLALALFLTFHASYGSAHPFLILWLVVGFTVIPLIFLNSTRLGWKVTVSFSVNAVVAVLIVFLAQTLVPHRMLTATGGAMRNRPLLDSRERFRRAAISTLALWPLLAFLAFVLSTKVSMAIYAGLFAITADLHSGFKGGLAMFIANMGGAVLTFGVYTLLVADHSVFFYILLMGGVVLFLARHKLSGKRTGILWGMALSCLLIVIGESTGISIQAGEKISTRLFEILVAVAYVVVALGLLGTLWKERKA